MRRLVIALCLASAVLSVCFAGDSGKVERSAQVAFMVHEVNGSDVELTPVHQITVKTEQVGGAPAAKGEMEICRLAGERDADGSFKATVFECGGGSQFRMRHVLFQKMNP